MDLQPHSISSIDLSYGDCMSCTFRLKFNSLRIIVIYRHPKPDFSTIFNEFSDLINAFLHHNEYKLMIVGDFNYHFDSSFQPHSLFKKLTESIGLHQHINCPTHVSGNILDLIFTPTVIFIFNLFLRLHVLTY